jgi:phage-related protein
VWSVIEWQGQRHQAWPVRIQGTHAVQRSVTGHLPEDHVAELLNLAEHGGHVVLR